MKGQIRLLVREEGSGAGATVRRQISIDPIEVFSGDGNYTHCLTGLHGRLANWPGVGFAQDLSSTSTPVTPQPFRDVRRV